MKRRLRSRRFRSRFPTHDCIATATPTRKRVGERIAHGSVGEDILAAVALACARAW